VLKARLSFNVGFDRSAFVMIALARVMAPQPLR
jgi:hypothetical protein